MMRVFFSAVLFMFVLLSTGYTADYYVDAKNGSDSNDGSLNKPFKTIQKAASTMSGSDVCIIRSGIYRETVTPKTGQTFQAYDEEYVQITGCDVLSGSWTQHSGQIYSKSLSSKVYDVFVDNDYMHIASFPDEDGDYIDKSDYAGTISDGGGSSGSVRFTRGGLPSGSLNGAYYNGRNGWNAFAGSHGRVTAKSGNTVTLTDLNFRWFQNLESHKGEGTGRLVNHLALLNAAKEWYWGSNILYLYAPGGGDPSGRKIEARTRLYAFNCSGENNITIEGINFKGASIVMDGSNDCVIDDCTFRYVSPYGMNYDAAGKIGGNPEQSANRGTYDAGHTSDGTGGIFINGARNVLKNSYIAYGHGALVTLLGSDGRVENNVITDGNWIGRMHTNPVCVGGLDQTILNNTISRSSGSLISFIMYNSLNIEGITIKGNDCRYYATYLRDNNTAAMYTNGNDDLKGAEISYNFIAENQTEEARVASGIYLDDRGHNAVIHHNVIDGDGANLRITMGILTNGGNNKIGVYHNTFWDCQRGWSCGSTRDRETSTMFYRNNHASAGTRGLVYTGGNPTKVTEDHNRENVQAAELQNVDGYDFRLKSSSASINIGIPVSGINDGYNGSNPDLGAHEYNDALSFGSDITVPTEWYDDDPTTSVRVSPAVVPDKFVLEQNYPNPFNPITTISYVLPETADVALEIFNTQGVKQRTYRRGIQKGHQKQVWDGRNDVGSKVASGVYFYRINAMSKTQHFSETKKMILLK